MNHMDSKICVVRGATQGLGGDREAAAGGRRGGDRRHRSQ